MIDDAVIERYMRDANPIPDLDHLDADELARFVAVAQMRIAAATQAHPRHPARHTATTRRSSRQAWAFVAAFIIILASVGIAALVLQGSDAPVAEQPTTPAVTLPEPSPGQALPTGATPLPDFANALPGDDGVGPLPLGTVGAVPDNDRLDFLFEFCWPDCYRDAHFMDPDNPDIGSGTWTAGRPFHVRHGFVSNLAGPLGTGFDVVLYVTELDSPAGDAIGGTYRYTSDYVVRGTTDQCGPNYGTQTGPETCEWFVHDFPNGLPEGRHQIWAMWEAPCSAWVDLGFTTTCDDPGEVISLFSSGFDAPFGPFPPSFTEVNHAQLSPDEIMELYWGMESVFTLDPPVDPATVGSEEVAGSSNAAPPGDADASLDTATLRLPLGERTELPDSARLDFLATLCEGTCYRDAHVIDPSDAQMGFGRWAASLPFHIRHGFVNEAAAPLGDDFELVVSVTRRVGPEVDGGAYRIDQTYGFSSDYVLRDTTGKCGPGYWDQTQPRTCEWFVHEFPDGLPPGRYDIWAEWHAPCSAWLDLGLVDSCDDPGAVTSQFVSSVNMPFYGDGFTPSSDLPFDPYLDPVPITRGASTTSDVTGGDDE